MKVNNKSRGWPKGPNIRIRRLLWFAAIYGCNGSLAAAAISAEAADMVLLVDDVTRVVDALEIGQRTLSIAKQSICMD